MSNEIIIYQANNHSTRIEVNVSDETVWLTQQQIVELFDSSKANISEHIKNIFHTKELTENSTVRKIRTVRQEGNRIRVWLNKVLKDLGKKWFAFSKMKIDAKQILSKVELKL